jgi:stage V sporulation protein AC
MKQEEYGKLVEKTSPNTKILKNCVFAFLIGGLICALGQLIFNLYTMWGLELMNARAVTSVTLVAIAAILTAFHIYDDIAKVGGAGSLVPITGFSNAVASPAIEFKNEGYVMGVGGKMFVIAGPVLVYGVLVSSLYGVILWFLSFYGM